MCLSLVLIVALSNRKSLRNLTKGTEMVNAPVIRLVAINRRAKTNVILAAINHRVANLMVAHVVVAAIVPVRLGLDRAVTVRIKSAA